MGGEPGAGATLGPSPQVLSLWEGVGSRYRKAQSGGPAVLARTDHARRARLLARVLHPAQLPESARGTGAAAPGPDLGDPARALAGGSHPRGWLGAGLLPLKQRQTTTLDSEAPVQPCLQQGAVGREGAFFRCPPVRPPCLHCLLSHPLRYGNSDGHPNRAGISAQCSLNPRGSSSGEGGL